MKSPIMSSLILYSLVTTGLTYAQHIPTFPSSNLRQSVVVSLEPQVDTTRLAPFRSVISQQPGTIAAADAQISIAKVYFDSRAYGGAVKELDKFLQTYPASFVTDEVLHVLAQSYSRLRRDSQALQTAQTLLQKFPNSQWAEIAKAIAGKSFYNLHRFQEAAEVLNTIVEGPTGSSYRPEALLTLARAYRVLAKSGEAVKAYDRFIADYTQDEDFAVAKAEAAMLRINLGQYQKAIEDLSGALPQLRTAAEKSLAGYGLAWAYFLKGDVAVAQQEFQRVAAHYPTNPVAAYASFRVAFCMVEQKKHQDAITQLTTVERMFPDFVHKDWLLFFSATSYWELGQKDRAIQLLQQLLDRFPQSSFRQAAEKKLRGG